MPTVRLDIEYDGSGFRGWARQPGLRTVQGELETALATILREPIELTVAGRTDTGVHARGQVASFATAAEPARRPRPQPQRPRPRRHRRDAPRRVVADGFDARRDARSRTYRYRLLARRAPQPVRAGPRPLVAAPGRPRGPRRLRRAPSPAPTTSPPSPRPRPTTSASTATSSPPPGPRTGDVLAFEITADAFMRNMVRALVGTQLEVACGRRTAASFAQLLDGAPRSAGGDTAPPHGLYLESRSP